MYRSRHVTDSPSPTPQLLQSNGVTPTAPSNGGGGKHAAEPSVGQLVSDATTHLSQLLHSEIELAKLELRSSVKNAGTGVGLFGAAVVVLVFSLVFGFQAAAEGIAATGIWRWAAFLIVFVAQLLLVALFVIMGIRKVKKVRAPEKTIQTTRETMDYLKKSRG
jgi:uncharacterized membrane protein YqjE